MAGTVTGAGGLVRLLLRRDRVKLPVWVLAISAMAAYFFAVLDATFTSMPADQLRGFAHHPMMRLFGGPGYGFEQLDRQIFFVGGYGPEFLLGAALMSILLVVRHTRAEEQTGRAELVRAAVVGRHASLTAALAVAVLADAALVAVLTATVTAGGLPFGSALLFGCGVGVTGLAFAGTTAVAAQVTEHSRMAGALAGAVLAVAWTVRAVGDLVGVHGSTLSWFSPLAWPQQTRVLVDERWWPLALSVGFAAAAFVFAYALSSRRDFGAGLLRPRRGPARAGEWLRTPLALTWQLHRGGLVRWGVPLAVWSLVFGGLAGPLQDALRSLPEAFVPGSGGATVLDAYVALIEVMLAFLVSIYLMSSMQGLRAEETSGRLTPVLATATGRGTYLASHLVVLTGGAVFLFAAGGLGAGVGAAVTTGDAGYVGELAGYHLARAPEALVLLAVAVLLFGLVPRAMPAAWAVLLFGVVMRWWAPEDGPFAWLRPLSPYQHIPRMPLEPFTPVPLVALTVVALLLAAAGVYAFRRRDVAGP